MPIPLSGDPTELRRYLEGLEARVAELEAPNSPGRVFACEEADLPDAADFINCVVHVSDIPILAVSDGSDWIRQDTGAAI